MNISFGEILIIAFIALLFYKPSQIRGFVASFFKMKKEIEGEIHSITQPVKQKFEFFDENHSVSQNTMEQNTIQSKKMEEKKNYFEKEEWQKQQ